MPSDSHLYNIDFVKGLMAISVILLHTLPLSVLKDTFAVFHIWQAVPVFLFITFYLGFRKLEKTEDVFSGYYSFRRIKALFMKLWLPLIILAVFEAIYFFFKGDNAKAIGSLLCYGNGPGGYYIWCYMQIWLLLPVLYLFLKRRGVLIGGGYFIDCQCTA